jgi:iron complex transport system ATP-binding protein
MVNAMHLIDVKNIAFSYGKKSIFNNISLSMDKGEVLCLLGPNGCGKTTLLDCILGILNPEKGRILLNGKDTAGFKSGHLARSISYVPQGHVGTFPYTVLDMVLMGRAVHISMFSSPTKDDIIIAEEALHQVGLSHLKDHPYTQLSGGEGQLTLIARALAQKAPVIIMDEPTSHLDFRHELIVLETIMNLVREKNISIVMATHFPNHAFFFEGNHINTRVAMLHRGSFINTGTPEEALTEEFIQKLYGIGAEVISFGNNGKKKLKHVIPVRTIT